MKDKRFGIRAGVVQPYVYGFSTTPSIQHFDRPEWSAWSNVLKPEGQAYAQVIVDALNNGEITEEVGRNALKKY